MGQEEFLAVQVTKRRISGHGEAKCKSYVAAFPKDKLEFMSCQGVLPAVSYFDKLIKVLIA